MKTVTVTDGESWFDVAARALGTVEGMFEVMTPADSPDTLPYAGRVIRVSDAVLATEYETIQERTIARRLNPWRRVAVRSMQTWFDIALQELGAMDGVFDCLGSSDVLSTNPVTGRVLALANNAVVNRKVVDRYLADNIKPATALETEITIGDGIGYWTIGVDFEVQ